MKETNLMPFEIEDVEPQTVNDEHNNLVKQDLYFNLQSVFYLE